MSIDLFVDRVRRVRIEPLLPKISAVLADLLGLTMSPTLVLRRLEEGQELPVVSDEMGTDGSPLLLLSIVGHAEVVQLVAVTDSLAVSMSGSRSDLKYALGAAVAITLAHELAVGIWDDRRFFSDQVHTTPEALLAHLRVAGPNDEYHEAASRIQWGPFGGHVGAISEGDA